jgi:CHAD domain-containing protein
MPYELKPGHPAGKQILHVMEEQIAEALRQLRSKDIPIAERVHDTRVGLKRIRAALVLLRPVLGKSYGKTNDVFRKCGQKLSDVRDAEALVDTLEKLQKNFSEQLGDHSLDSIRKALLKNRREGLGNGTKINSLFREVIGDFNHAKAEIEAWPKKVHQFLGIEEEITATYRQGRKAFHTAYQKQTAPHFHEWRKAVKRHLYHAELSEKMWPKAGKGYRKSVKQLADLLGDEHNLAILREQLLKHSEELGEKKDEQVLLALIDQWQAQLRAEAQPLGDRIFAEKPRQFRERFQDVHSASETEKEQKPFLKEKAPEPATASA